MKKIYNLLSIALFGFASITANAQCDYSIQMDDSFGDGWNGGQLSITIAGTTTIHELLTGSTQTDLLSTSTGDSIIVDFLGGSSWNGEITFTLLDASGTVVYASPVGPTVGVNYADVTACPANDVSVSNVMLSALGSCGGAAETITVEVSNLGTNPQSGFNVNYILNGTAGTPENIAGPLAPGASVMYTFTATVDLSAAMTYNVDAFTMLVGDQGTGNDTSSVTFINGGASITTFPYTENFDSNANATTGTFANGWYANSTATFDWTAATAGTPSTGTGPAAPASGTGAYMFTEATGSAQYDEARLYSPCLDLSIATAATLDFTYLMYGADMGDLYVEASLNGAWVVLDSIIGETHTSDTAAWLTKSIDLSSVSGGTTTIRFSGVRGIGFTSDIAIDDVAITLTGFVSVNEFSKDSFTIYPNPNNGTFSLASGEVNDKVLINIFDVQGRIVYSSQKQIVPGAVSTVSLGSVENGIYLVNIVSSTGRFTQTIIVE